MPPRVTRTQATPVAVIPGWTLYEVETWIAQESKWILNYVHIPDEYATRYSRHEYLARLGLLPDEPRGLFGLRRAACQIHRYPCNVIHEEDELLNTDQEEQS